MDQVIASLLGTMAFVILFHAERRDYIFAAASGMIGWMSYLGLQQLGASAAEAALGATFLLMVVSRILSAVRRSPVTVFLVPGIFPLVPGYGVYRTAYYLFRNNLADGTREGVNTFKVAMAIALGIVFAYAIPQAWFHKPKTRRI
ncbi:hypothetical protein FACS1894111_04210 [Clostridia bacterium]|nr:hypothetical protein FACS1894111_04210 [Clostridia bacterium]